MKRLILYALSWLIIIAMFVITFSTRLHNPDMAETRLLLSFWPRWIAVMSLGVIALILSAIAANEKTA